MSWHSDSWRDSYDAWKTREPDDYRRRQPCAQCSADVQGNYLNDPEPLLCDDCVDMAELNSLHADPAIGFDPDEFFESLQCEPEEKRK